MAAYLEDLPMTVNPLEVMQDQQTWMSIARPDETPIPYASFTTHESADSFDSAFDYRTPSFQHLSNVLNCSGFQLTEQEQSYLLSAISATKPPPSQPLPRRRSSSPTTTSYNHNPILSGRIHKPYPSPRRFSKPSHLHEPTTPGNEDSANPFSSLAPIQHSLGPKDVPRFYGMRITAQEIDMLEDLLGNGEGNASSEEDLASPVPSLGWSDGAEDAGAYSPAEEVETVSPWDVFARPEGREDRAEGIRGIFIPSDEEDEDVEVVEVDRGEKGKGKAEERGHGSGEQGVRRASVVPMEDEERESYKADLAPIRAYSWKGRLSPARRSSVGV